MPPPEGSPCLSGTFKDSDPSSPGTQSKDGATPAGADMAFLAKNPQADLLTPPGGEVAAGPVGGHFACPWDATKATPNSIKEEKKRKWVALDE